MNLVDEIKQYIPIPVHVKQSLIRSLAIQNPQNDLCYIIEDVFEAEQEGGIVCMIRGRDHTLFGVSITHLKLPKEHPLKNKIEAYQMRRMQNITRHEGVNIF